MSSRRAMTKADRSPGSVPTTVVLLILVPLLYCAAELLGHDDRDGSLAEVETSVEGVVTGARFGDAVAGATVLLWQRDPETKYPLYSIVARREADSLGRFTVTHKAVVPTSYRLSVRADGYKTAGVSTINTGRTSDVVVRVQEDVPRATIARCVSSMQGEVRRWMFARTVGRSPR